MSNADARVGVVFGGPSPEHDVSILTGLQAARALVGGGRRAVGLYWSKTGGWFQVDAGLEASAFVDGVPAGAQPVRLIASGEEAGFAAAGGRLGRARLVPVDVVVNCCHGGPGENGTLQGAFDLAAMAYTGPGAAAAALGMDKLAFTGVARDAGLPVLPRALLRRDGAGIDFDGPYILKPRHGGSSIGVEVVEDHDTARARLGANPHLRDGAVIEPYRRDLFDLNVAVRTWPDVSLSAIERPERAHAHAEILGYADKYVGGEGMASAPRQLPAAIPDGLADTLRRAAVALVELVGLRGVTRVDFLSDGVSELYVNEVNTIPGSLARYLWVDPPVSFSDLLDGLVAEALAHPAAHHSAAGADGAVLRSAGGIASKLA